MTDDKEPELSVSYEHDGRTSIVRAIMWIAIVALVMAPSIIRAWRAM